MKLIFATGNMGKMREIRDIMADVDVEVLSMKEADIYADVVEDGTTFMENAFIKARAISKIAKEKNIEAIVLADDSGLVVDALNGEPGIYSARYMGEDTPYSIKNAKIIERLEGVKDEDRSARFVCAISAVLPDGSEKESQATYEGRIGYEEKGPNGFGYDPIFYLPERGCTRAEISTEEKNEISHRGKALRLMRDRLMNMGVFC